MQTMTENTNNTPADCAARVELRKKADEAADRFAALPARELFAAVKTLRHEMTGRGVSRWIGYLRTGDENTRAWLILDTAPTGYNTAPTPSAFVFVQTADNETPQHRSHAVARIDNRADELAEMILADLIPG